VISFAAGSFNYLPSDPFDGGKMAKIILEPYFGFMKFKSKKETRKFIGRLFIWLVLLAFLLNIIPYITLIF
jgi:membrane-associated protease RseP (regulator of RpoE activity)